MAIRHVGASSTRGLLTSLRRPSGPASHRLPPMPSAVVRAPDVPTMPPQDVALAPDVEQRQGSVASVPADAPGPKSPADAANAATIARLATDVAQVRVGGPPPTDRVPPVDYRSILAAAVADLVANTPAARREIYDHARLVVYQRLNGIQPPLSSFATAREELLLDRAIEKIEAENLARSVEVTVTPAAEESTTDIPVESPANVPEPAPPDLTSLDRTPPPLVTAERARRAQSRQLHGIMLRTFGLVGVVAACMFGLWLATGKPNLTGARSMTRSFSQLLTKASPGAAREQPQVAAADASPPAASAPTTTPMQRVDGAQASAQGTPDAGTDLWSMCREAAPNNEFLLCPSGSPSTAAAVIDPRSPYWVAAYSGLAEASGPPRAPRSGVTATTTRNAAARDRFERALERARADDLERALVDFSEAIRLDPQFTDAYLQRGQARFRNGDVEGAITDFTRALELDPRHAAAYKARGMAMLYKSNDDAAIADLSKAIQHGELERNGLPAIDIFYARRSRAALFDRKQLYDRELGDLSAMIDGYWKNPDLAASLRASYREQGSANLMASIYRMRAGVHLKRNNVDAAIGDMSFAIQLDAQRALQFTLERARIQENAGRRAQATADFERALELSPKNSEAQAGLVRLKSRT
jgi:tetratricopeptide (TPR) repeat protein